MSRSPYDCGTKNSVMERDSNELIKRKDRRIAKLVNDNRAHREQELLDLTKIARLLHDVRCLLEDRNDLNKWIENVATDEQLDAKVPSLGNITGRQLIKKRWRPYEG